MIAPAIHPVEKPCASPMPTKAMPMVAIVVHELPVITDAMLQSTQQATKKKSVCMTCNP